MIKAATSIAGLALAFFNARRLFSLGCLSNHPAMTRLQSEFSSHLADALPEMESAQRGNMAHELRWNPELQEWFCARCGRTSDHLRIEEAEIEIEVFPCKLYQHVIHRYRPERKS